MDIRRIATLSFLGVVIGLAAGCGKSEPAQPPPSAPPRSTSPPPGGTVSLQTVARLHWLGKQRLATEPNATNFMGVWHWPESVRLETQTLEKLSTAPWRLLRGAAAISNAPTALLRPLLDDVLQAESFLEIHAATNGPGEMAFAIRLDNVRAGLWETNLAAVMESLTGIRVTAGAGGQGWSLKKQFPSQEGAGVGQHRFPDLIEFARAGDWVLVGIGGRVPLPGGVGGGSSSFAELLRRIQRDGVPFDGPASSNWLEADFDLNRVASALSLNWKLPEDLPRVSVIVTGDGENVRTRAELKFNQPLSIEFEPWNIPTNLIGEPLNGFTAIRGIRTWVASLKFWNDLQVGPPPNQLFVWSHPGIIARAYFAAPQAEASNRVHRLAGRLMDGANPQLAAGGWGRIERSNEIDGAAWLGIPFMAASFQAVATSGGNFVLGGSFMPPLVTSQPPAGLLQAVQGRTNLVCYEWEITGTRIETWLYISQLLRMVSGKSQLPLDSACIAWFKFAATRLGNSVTFVTQTDQTTLSVGRSSAVGFSAAELHLLADWLESPQFPSGLHTFLAPAPKNHLPTNPPRP